MRPTRFTLVILALAVALSFASGAEAALSYRDLHPPGWVESRAVCINGAGEVAGSGRTAAGEERGFLWSRGTFTEIVPPGAQTAHVSWISGRGEIAGTATFAGCSRAFVYSEGRYTLPLPEWSWSEAAYIGEDGAVAGGGEHGAYVTRNGATELYAGLSAVIGGNAARQLIGSTDNGARLYLPGKGYQDLNPPSATGVTPRAINESGLVALSSRYVDTERGFVFSGGFYVFMTPPGWTSSTAMSVNNNGEVVGYGDCPEGRRGFFRSGSRFEDVSFPGWVATEPASINDVGQMAGTGKTASGEAHAFLASPEEPQAGEPAPARLPDSSSGGGCRIVSGGAAPSDAGTGAFTVASLLLPLLVLRLRRQAV